MASAPAILVALILLLLPPASAASASASASSASAASRSDPHRATAAASSPGIGTRTVQARTYTLTYTAEVDPNLVLSHSTKMRWSRPRHAKGYDPTHPLASSVEEEDPTLRPTLCQTLTRRLGAEAFSALVGRLEAEEARAVMEWRDGIGDGPTKSADAPEVDMTDLEPRCSYARGRERRYGRSEEEARDDASEVPEELREIEQTCRMNFDSIVPYHAISFDLSLTLHDTPMPGLSPQDVAGRITPDRRGWTRPVRRTEARLSLTVTSPDHTPGTGVVGNAPPDHPARRRRERDRKGNAREAAERVAGRADAVLNVWDSDREGTDGGSRVAVVRAMPRLGEGQAAGDAGERGGEEEYIPPHVFKMCDDAGLGREKCREALKIMKQMEDEKEGGEEEKARESVPEPNPTPEPGDGARRRQSADEVVDETEAWLAADSLDGVMRDLEADDAAGMRVPTAVADGGGADGAGGLPPDVISLMRRDMDAADALIAGETNLTSVPVGGLNLTDASPHDEL